MRTLSPHLIATACAVVACAVLPAVAHADPPRCTTRAPVTGVAGQELFLGLGDTCTDADGDQLAFTIVDAPAHGQVAPPDELGFTAYQPDPGFTGDDSFTFRASDGTSDSGLVTVTLTVAPNQPPDCPASYAIKVEPGETTSFDPFDEGRPCFDPDGLFLDFAVVTPPSHGTISDFESFGGALYTPEPGYSGPDSFTFTATDGVNTTAPITVSITVLPPNRAPVCVPVFKLRVAPGAVQPLDPKLACRDPDGDPMFPSLVSGPSHGKLGVSPAIDITYTPDAGYIGPDEIAFQMQDSRGGLSAVSRLAIDVAGPVMIPPQPKPDTTAPRLRVTIPAQTLQSV